MSESEGKALPRKWFAVRAVRKPNDPTNETVKVAATYQSRTTALARAKQVAKYSYNDEKAVEVLECEMAWKVIDTLDGELERR